MSGHAMCNLCNDNIYYNVKEAIEYKGKTYCIEDERYPESVPCILKQQLYDIGSKCYICHCGFFDPNDIYYGNITHTKFIDERCYSNMLHNDKEILLSESIFNSFESVKVPDCKFCRDDDKLDKVCKSCSNIYTYVKS